MKTKIVYVLVSSPNDIYLEQAYVSMFSVKYYMPDSKITLLTDKLTADTFEGIRKKEVQYANEVVVVELDGTKMNAQQRSRQLKTSIRNRIQGDYLFIDCDTIITKRLDDIDNIDAEIAACRDTHSTLADNPYRGMHLRDGHKLGWPIENEIDYFNSGVIYVKDTPITHEFYKRWNENLNLGYPKQVFMDQPSFAKTNYEMGHIIQHLPDVWNCELKHGIRYLKDAKIVHYLCTNPSYHQNKQLFILNEKDCLLEIKNAGIISDKIKSVVDDPFNGLAEITHCFSGEDVYFFQTEKYNILRTHFNQGHSFVSEKLMLWESKLRRKMKPIISLVK